MKSPDDRAACFARLRREVLEAFEAGDMETFARANADLREMLDNGNRRSELALARSRRGGRFMAAGAQEMKTAGEEDVERIAAAALAAT